NLFSNSDRDYYENTFCEHRGYSRIPRAPLMDIGSKQHLLEIIRGVDIPESVTCPPPIEPPPPTPIFTVSSLDKNFIYQGARNTTLIISGEGVNLPTNEEGRLTPADFSVDFVNTDTGRTITMRSLYAGFILATHGPYGEHSFPVPLADFPNYYELSIEIALPNDLELGHYRIFINVHNERIGANSTRIADELFEVRRRPAPQTPIVTAPTTPARGLPTCRVFPPAQQEARRNADPPQCQK
ncbi:MAG: hypothetical protein WCT39_06045, partial [Candidatus Margulisiibacteriota bacterium]